jgi:NitT/TauT family transport system permease protein
VLNSNFVETAPPNRIAAVALPLATLVVLLAAWAIASRTGALSTQFFPTPGAVKDGFLEEWRSGALLRDTGASLVRVSIGYAISVVAGVPLGILLGSAIAPRLALLPLLNFLRSLSPLAWIPFAIYWIGIGHGAVVFLIVLAALPAIALSTLAAVAGIPKVYHRVAQDYGLTGAQHLVRVVFPAILPQLVITLRVAMGLSWLVMVAGEMLAGNTGLGYLIHDANNGLRLDLIVVGMLAIGFLGIAFDRLLQLLSRIPAVRWGTER